MPGRTLALAALAATLILSLSPSGAQVRAERSVSSPNQARSRAAARVPAPKDVLGFKPGDDRKLASWAQVVDYFRKLDEGSDRVKFEELGRTTMGAPFVMATISAPENLARLDEFKEIQAALADPRKPAANSDSKARRLIARGKTIVLITCGIHSTEVGSYLSSMLIAHRLASSDDADVQDILRNSIVLLVPSLNPDGVDIVKNWYDKTLGTPFEGTDPPTLYHKYTGHDNNRDWYAFTQRETQITVEKIHNVWHPQIVHDIHQMGTTGARLFLPPYTPPVEPNVPRQIVEGYTELGRSMASEMRVAGFKGITTDSIFDAWTPARAYSHYHGGVRILSETASAKIATPINLKFDELRAGRDYDPRKVSANFPELWTGGEWRLRDITNYMTTAAFSLMKHAARNRERWLTRFYEIGKEAVRERTQEDGLAAVIIFEERENHEAISQLLRILKFGGVEIYLRQDRIKNGGKNRAFNSYIIPIAQPYGAFAKALLETQRYPELLDTEGNPISPYDVTSHTLPLLMNVNSLQVKSRTFKDVAPKLGRYTKSPRPFYTPCSVSHPCFEKPPAIYRSHVPSMDEGWTRWVLENSAVSNPKFLTVQDKNIRAGNLSAKYDAIIIPDQSPGAILNGYKRGSMPDEYTGGLGKEGVKSLREFVEQGGTLVFLNRASDFAIEQLDLPVRNVAAGLKRTEFYVPGSILRIELDRLHPITKGMPRESIAWVEDSPVFEIKSDPLALVRVRIIARYPQTADPLLSGWLLGRERIKGKAALVEVGLGKGRVYLFGFRPQYRGQSLATYPLFFNALRQTGGN